MRLTRIFLFVVALVFWPGVAIAVACPEHVTAESWKIAFKGGPQARDDFLSFIKSCVPGSSVIQQEVDNLAVTSFFSLHNTDKAEQPLLAAFAVQALLINAEAGFPPSQHNYAAAHNAASYDLVRLFVPQDYPTFLYWTRKAAAQKEPRALFNLAVRMASDSSKGDIVQNLPTAYVIFSYLEKNATGLLPPELAHVSNFKSSIAKKLGEARRRQLNADVASFDFSILAESPLHAASFDCGKAGNRIEKMICSSAELSELDSDVSEAFRLKVHHSLDEAQERAIQKYWLKAVRGICPDKECLRKAYLERLDALQIEPANTAEDKALFEIRCDSSKGEIVVAGVKSIGGANTQESDIDIKRYLVAPGDLTETTESDTTSFRTASGRKFFYCQLGQSRYKITIEPHIENANINGECGAGNADISLTIHRNKTMVMSGLEFEHCRVGVNTGRTIAEIVISESSQTVKVTAIPEITFLPVRFVKTINLLAPPSNWMGAIFEDYPTGDINADLFIAVYKGDISAIKQAIERGADPNVKDLTGFPPLALLGPRRQDAYFKNRSEEFNRQSVEIAKLLFMAKATGIAVNENGVTLLNYLVGYKVPDSIIDMVMLHGAEPDEITLSNAAVNGDAYLVQKLLDKGVDPNFPPSNGLRALEGATMYGLYSHSGWTAPPIEEYAKCARLLLQHGADIKEEKKDPSGLPARLIRQHWKDERLKIIFAELIPYMSQDQIAQTAEFAGNYSNPLALWLQAKAH